MERDRVAELPYIEIIPIGDVDHDALQQVTKTVEKRLKLSSRLIPPINKLDRSFEPRRNQYNASVLLDELRKSKSTDALKALGVIEEDIFSRGLNYVFGQAVLGGCCGVISLSRLRLGTDVPDGKKLFLARVEKEVTHELGHTFGLRHCPNPKCIMYFSSNIEDTDRKEAVFCPECGIPIP